MKPRVLLSEMTREQIRESASKTTVVLPVSSTEQHGPHLPVQTDNLICLHVCQRAAELAMDRTWVTVAPAVHFGSSHHHFPYAGVLSLSTATFMAVVREVCESLVRSGFERIALINGHGGNDDSVRVVATELSLAHPVSVAVASYWTIAGPALVEEGQAENLGRLPGHAGAFETSAVMALRPDLVDLERIPAPLALPPIRADLRHLPRVFRPGEAIGAGPGYTDNPAGGSAETGRRMLDIVTLELTQFLVDFGEGRLGASGFGAGSRPG